MNNDSMNKNSSPFITMIYKLCSLCCDGRRGRALQGSGPVFLGSEGLLGLGAGFLCSGAMFPG